MLSVDDQGPTPRAALFRSAAAVSADRSVADNAARRASPHRTTAGHPGAAAEVAGSRAQPAPGSQTTVGAAMRRSPGRGAAGRGVRPAAPEGAAPRP